MPVISFSPRKAAIVLYGLTGSVGALSLLKQLGKHSKGKGCLYIKKLAEVDQEVLKKPIAMSVAAKEKNDLFKAMQLMSSLSGTYSRQSVNVWCQR